MAEHCDGINDSGFDAKLMTKGKKNKRRGSEAEKINATRSPAAGECVCKELIPFIASARLAHPPHCSALSLPRLPRIPVPAFLHVGTGTNSTGRNFWPQKNSSVGLPAKPQKQKRCLPLPPPANPIFIARLTRILARLERVGELGRHGGGSFGSLVLLVLLLSGFVPLEKCAECARRRTYCTC